MTIRIVTIKFNDQTEIFDDETLAAFLINKKVKKLKPYFFQQGNESYWTVYIEYVTILDEPKVEADELNNEQKRLLHELQKWRKDLANEKKMTSFIISTNRQLIEVALKAPKTLQALRAINGYGKKKIEQFGQQIIDIIKKFYPSESPAKTEKSTLPSEEALKEDKTEKLAEPKKEEKANP